MRKPLLPSQTNEHDARTVYQRTEATFESIPVDGAVARAYGRVYAAVATAGRARGRRTFDLLIAATALAAELPLYTCNPGAFRQVEALIEVVRVPTP